MADQWHYSINGNQSGPVSSSELKQFASSGKLSQTDLIWKDGMQDWVPAGKVKGLFSVQANTASPRMPPPISPQLVVRPQGGMPPPFSPPPSSFAPAAIPKTSLQKYETYEQVPVYNKQWVFWLLYIMPILNIAALGILLFSDVYYVKKGIVVSFGVANRIVAAILLFFYFWFLWGIFMSALFLHR